MAMVDTLDCSLCRIIKKRKQLYGHVCKNWICYDCIYKNILFYLRIQCPYCRVDYSEKEIYLLVEVEPSKFRDFNKKAINKMMSDCECGYDMMERCSKQSQMMEKMGDPSFMDNFVITLTKTFLYIPFTFVLAMQKEANNIIIFKYENFIRFIMSEIQLKFLRVLGVDRFIIYHESHDTEVNIPVYSTDKLFSMLPDKITGKNLTGKLEIDVLSYFHNKFINGNEIMVDKLVNQEDIDVTFSFTSQGYIPYLIHTVGRIISLPEEAIVSRGTMCIEPKKEKCGKNRARKLRRKYKRQRERAART